jgi:hypothetical protein
MKQTAVEFLYEALWEAGKDKFIWQIILQQAKEMEKEQSIEIPSDEEIEKILYYRSNAYYEGFYAAITMLRNKIKEGNI